MCHNLRKNKKENCGHVRTKLRLLFFIALIFHLILKSTLCNWKEQCMFSTDVLGWYVGPTRKWDSAINYVTNYTFESLGGIFRASFWHWLSWKSFSKWAIFFSDVRRNPQGGIRCEMMCFERLRARQTSSSVPAHLEASVLNQAKQFLVSERLLTPFKT